MTYAGFTTVVALFAEKKYLGLPISFTYLRTNKVSKKFRNFKRPSFMRETFLNSSFSD